MRKQPIPNDGLVDAARATARMIWALANNAGSDDRRQYLRAFAAELELTARILEVEALACPIQW